MVDDLPVGFLRYPLVETPVAGFHMEDGDMPLFGGNRAQAGIGIPQHQEGIGADGFEHIVYPEQDIPGRAGRIAGGGFEEIIGLTQAELLEKHLAELVIVILPRMNQYVIYGRGSVELAQYAR